MATGLIDEDLGAFLEGDGAQYIGTIGPAGMPSAGRAWGLTVNDDGVLVRMVVGADVETAANLEPRNRVALCVTDVATFRSVQLKGSVISVAAPDDDDLAVYDAYRQRFTAAITSAGGTTPMESVWPAHVVAVTIAVDALFDQTPGPNAGAGLGAATP